MKRFLLNLSARLPLSISTLLLLLVVATTATAKQPNFVWILSEDNSKHYLKLFDEDGATTPNIEALAKHGVKFTRAFSCGPVCSVARTTLATSCYAPRIGSQYHRKSKVAAMPPGWRMFPAYLRDAGYYTTNNAKKDYNVVETKDVWDASSRKAHWRNRPTPETPFFHMQTYTVSHESSLHFNRKTYETEKTKADPNSVAVAPYHPDTPLFRYTVARYHDRIQMADELVGKLVQQLEDDGLLENTFIFYFGDHGGVLPGSKGYIQERGVHVPLVVRIPDSWKGKVDREYGSSAKGFVSFVDFGPTLLHLAGVGVPEHMDGKPFLGDGFSAASVDRQNVAFTHADRFDEKYDLVRGLRRGKFKYIRNYFPFYPDGLQNNYRYRMLAYQEWRTLFQEGKLDPKQAAFFLPREPEALYDLEADPHETVNLAKDPAYQDKLLGMRQQLQRRLKRMPDLSFFPESVQYDNAAGNLHEFAYRNRFELEAYITIADLMLLPYREAEPQLAFVLTKKEDPLIRYWALIACTAFGKQAESLLDEVKANLDHPEPLVRLRAVEFLGDTGLGDPTQTLQQVIYSTEHPIVASLALHTVVHLRDHPHNPLRIEIDPKQIKAKGDGVKRRLEYLLKP